MDSILILGAIWAMAVAVPSNPNPWEEVDASDGIRVWAREVPGSSVREVKAEAVVPLPPERLWAVLSDIDSYVEFMPYVVEAKVLEKTGETSQYEYQLIDPPFVDRRDYTLAVRMDVDEAKGRYRRSWVPANDKGPGPIEDVVRVSVCEGAWTVEKRGPNQSWLEYWLYTDPGGSIPSWIANKANKTSVPDLLNAVRKRARDPGWKRD